eukprot:g72974.t1
MLVITGTLNSSNTIELGEIHPSPGYLIRLNEAGCVLQFSHVNICRGDNTFFQSSEEGLDKTFALTDSEIAPSPSVTTLTRFSPFQRQGNVFHSSSSSAVIFLAEFGTDDGNVDVTDLADG